MAWITVDQKLIGGKLRDFAKRSGISQNEAVGVLIRLWLWGLDNADENGRIIAADHEDIEEAIRPGFLETDRGAISKIVTNLVECGWIDREKGCLYLHDWIDWRSFYNSYEEKKAKHAERMRNYRASRAKTAEPAESEPTESNPEKMEEPEKEVAEEKPKKNTYAVAFEEFWKVYPRKVDKGNAYKKYQARLNDGFREEELLTAATNYAAECQRERTEARYIKHPRTFLSDTMPFTDYLDKSKPEPQETSGNAVNPFRRA